MALTFPSNPSDGDTVTSGDITWTYNEDKDVWQNNVIGLSGASFNIDADVGAGGSVEIGSDTLQFTGGVGITTTLSDDEVTFDLNNTAVTTGTYGTSNTIPRITVDQQGRITSISTVENTPTAEIGVEDATITATDIVSSTAYVIKSLGNTSWTSLGAIEIGIDDGLVTGHEYIITDRGTAEAVTGITTGSVYEIITPGDTDFTQIGADDSVAGTTFTATGAGTGTGTVLLISNWIVYGTDTTPAIGEIFKAKSAGTEIGIDGISAGTEYRIVTVGTSNFLAIGASSNEVGTVFTATGAGTGTGTAVATPLIDQGTGTVIQTDFTATSDGSGTGTVMLDSEHFMAFVDSRTGTSDIFASSAFTYNPGKDIITAGNLNGTFTGNFAGAFDGVFSGTFDSSANAPSASVATTVVITKNTDDTVEDPTIPDSHRHLVLTDGRSGIRSLQGDSRVYFDNSTDSLNAPGFTDGTLSILSGSITSAAAITASGTITAGTLTDGTLSISSGAITAATNITASGTVQFADLSDGTITVSGFVDEDSMTSDSATLLPTQQSVKAYVDAQVAAKDQLSELSGDTDDISEGLTNKYHTTERVQDVVSGQLVTNGSHAGISFSYDDANDGAIDATVSLSSFDTGDLSEGTNLYYTTARFNTDFAAKDTGDLSEGTNLYYTDQRVDDYVSGGTLSGLHVTSNGEIDGNLIVDGNLTVNGTTVTINTANLDIEDNLLHMASGNTGHTTDVGFLAHYNESSTELEEGFVKDQSAGIWKLVTNVTHLSSGTNVDFTNAVYDDMQLNDLTAVDITITGKASGDLKGDVYASNGTSKVLESGTDGTDATFTGNVTGDLTGDVTGDVTGNADTASSLQTARTIELTGPVEGSASFDGSANISITTNLAAGQVTLGTDTSGNYLSDISAGDGISVTHTPAEGSTATIAISSLGVTTAKLANDAVDNTKLKSSTTTDADRAVTTDHIRDDAVTNTKIASNSVDNTKLKSSASTDSDRAVTTDHIRDDAVTLGTKTSGNYVQTIAGTTNEISVTGGSGEGSTPTIGLPNNVEISDKLTVHDQLIINGDDSTVAILIPGDESIQVGSVQAISGVNYDAPVGGDVIIHAGDVHFKTAPTLVSCFIRWDRPNTFASVQSGTYTTYGESRLGWNSSGYFEFAITGTADNKKAEVRANNVRAIDGFSRVSGDGPLLSYSAANPGEAGTTILYADATSRIKADIVVNTPTASGNTFAVETSASYPYADVSGVTDLSKKIAIVTTAADADTDAEFPITFINNTGGSTYSSVSYHDLEKDSGVLTYNPNTGALTATSFIGNIAGTSSIAQQVNINSEETSTSSHYLTFVTGTSSARDVKADSGLSYVPSTGTLTVANLTVSGTTTTLNTTTLDVADLNITIAKNASNSTEINGAGLTFGAWSSGTTPTITWDHSNTRFAANYDIATNIVGNVTGDVTGNADTATALETARTIGGVSFDGSANINLPGVNTSGNQDTSGNAATASQVAISTAGSNSLYRVALTSQTAGNRSIVIDSGISYSTVTDTLVASNLILTGANDLEIQTGKFFGDLKGDVYASNGTSKILEAGTDGTDAVLTGTVSSLTNHNTDDLSQGTTNLYLTDATFNTKFAAKDTDDLSEGTTNLYYTDTRFNSSFSSRDTDTLSEGTTNKYFTNERAMDAIGPMFQHNNHTGASAIYDDVNNRVDLTITSSTNLNVQDSGNTDASWYVPMSAGATGSQTIYTDTGLRFNPSSNTLTATTFSGALDGAPNSLNGLDTDDLSEGSNLYYTDSRARGSLSVSANTGDGDFSYNSSTGAFSYTGPSSTDYRAAFSAGTGITLSSGQISIGQAVGTSNNVEFNLVTAPLRGSIRNSDNVTIFTNGSNSVDAVLTGNVKGNVLNSVGTAVLSSGSNVVAATFTGNVTGDLTGDVTGDVTGNADTATALSSSRTFSASGDATASGVSFNGTGNVDLALTLANSGVTAGQVGSSTAIPVITVDSKGRVTATSTVSPASASLATASAAGIASFSSDNFDISGSGQVSIKTGGVVNAELANSSITASDGTTSASISLGSTLTFNSSDFGISTSPATVTLVDSGVTAGQVGSSTAIPVITVDSKGRLTATSTASLPNISIYADSGSTSIVLGTDTITFEGGDGIDTTVDTDTDTVEIKVSSGGISSTMLQNAAVTTGKLEDDAVTSAKLDSATGTEAVITDVIRDAAVTSAKISSSASTDTARAITTDHIRDNAVDSTKLKSSATTDSDRSVSTDHIKNNAVVLGTKTSGNYVAAVAGTTNEIEVSGSGEGATITVGLPDDVTIGSDLTVTDTLTVNGSTTLGNATSDSVSVSGNLTVAGNLTVNGDSVVVEAATISVEDSLIELARGNTSSDTLDIGLYGIYDTSGSQDLYAGLFRDASDGKWNLFKDSQSAPSSTVDKTATGYSIATLVANLEGDVTGDVYASNGTSKILEAGTDGSDATFTGDVIGNADTADVATQVTISANNTANEICYIPFVDGATGSQGLETDTSLYYNPSTNRFFAGNVQGTFIGNLTGNVTGNITGNVSGGLTGDVSGNAGTATTLQIARNFTIDGTDHTFDGSSDIDLTEALQDAVGAMFTGNTESGTSVTYDDTDGTLDVVTSGLYNGTTKLADTTATAITVYGHILPDTTEAYDLGSPTARFRKGYFDAGTIFLGTQEITATTDTISVSGNFTASNITGDLIGSVTGSADTLTTARNITVGTVDHTFDGSSDINLTEAIQDVVGSMFSGNTETNITVTYDDTDGTIDLVASGGASAGDAVVTISDSAPSSPVSGALWWNSTSLTPFIYYSDGTSNQWVQFASPDSGGSSTTTEPNWLVKTSAYEASTGDKIIVNGTSAITITLPASPEAGAFVKIKNISTYDTTIARNSNNIDSAAQNGTVSAGRFVELVYVDSTIGWVEI